MTTIAFLLKSTSLQLASSDNPNLEAEVLLAHALQVSRTYLYAWSDKALTEADQENYQRLIARRLQGEPIAYITGKREFWSLDLIVTPDTLIPRPETELLVEIALTLSGAEEFLLADLGTGSGAIALAIAKEKPTWQIHATDYHLATLEVAKYNAERHGIKNIIFHQGNWCKALPATHFDAIISNPPYIAKGDGHLNQQVMNFEPNAALFAEEEGLKDIRFIIQDATSYLKQGGYLLIEHGWQQSQAVKALFLAAGYKEVVVYQDLAGLDRAIMGRFFGA